MQLNGNRFCGDVILSSFNMSFRYEDSIKDQKYEKKIFWELHYENFKFKNDWGKSHNNRELLKLSFNPTLIFIPKCIVIAIHDDISAKTVPFWLHHTVYGRWSQEDLNLPTSFLRTWFTLIHTVCLKLFSDLFLYLYLSKVELSYAYNLVYLLSWSENNLRHIISGGLYDCMVIVFYTTALV